MTMKPRCHTAGNLAAAAEFQLYQLYYAELSIPTDCKVKCAEEIQFNDRCIVACQFSFLCSLICLF